MNNTRQLTEAALLSSIFIIITIVSISTGFGYAIYLDFIVPVFFCIVCMKCSVKYTVLSGITSILIVGMVLGDIGSAIWASQSSIIGIMCGYFISKNLTILDDILCTSIIGIIVMVSIDIFFSTLIGYSFMQEFQSFTSKLPYKNLADTIYYIFIALFPMGTVFSVYILSLFVARKLNILKGNSKKKMYIVSNFKKLSGVICCSEKVYYLAISYIVLVELLKIVGGNIESTYIKTILISTQYICIYFAIRDSFISIQNYIVLKYNKILYVRIITIATIILLIKFMSFTIFILIFIDIMLNRKINIRLKQINIIDNYVSNIVHK